MTSSSRRRPGNGAVADLIDSLDDAQLNTPSLCAGWSVRTVAAPSGSTPRAGSPRPASVRAAR
jgi:hypothetical protein